MYPLKLWTAGSSLQRNEIMLAHFRGVPRAALRDWLTQVCPWLWLDDSAYPCLMRDGQGLAVAGVSFSYAGELSAVVIALDLQLGLDVACVQELDDAALVTRLFLGEVYSRELAAADDAAYCFARMWAAFEARNKCQGRGISELPPGLDRYAAAEVACLAPLLLGDAVCCIAWQPLLRSAE